MDSAEFFHRFDHSQEIGRDAIDELVIESPLLLTADSTVLLQVTVETPSLLGTTLIVDM